MSWQDGKYGCRKQQHRHKQPIAKGMQDTAKTQNTATTLPSNLVRTNHKIRRHPETILMLEWCSSCMHAWNHTQHHQRRNRRWAVYMYTNNTGAARQTAHEIRA